MEKLDELIAIALDDMKNRPTMFNEFISYILQYTGDNFVSRTESYSEMFYELQWPDEKMKETLSRAKFDADAPVGILVSGVVIDNQVIDVSRSCSHKSIKNEREINES